MVTLKIMGRVEEDWSVYLDGYDAAVKLRALLVVFSNDADGVLSMKDICRDSMITSQKMIICLLTTMMGRNIAWLQRHVREENILVN